jgi:DNA-3-methyladenine glycosylase
VVPASQLVPLKREFYLPGADEVAPNLLGHWLIRTGPDGISGGPIVETEAYLRDDPACHASRGMTNRNRVMFGPPGHAYVYFVYGCHFCANAVCGPAGVGEAVLIRAIEPEFGTDLMRKRRPDSRPNDLTRGPARLCEALAIARRLDGADLCNLDSSLIIVRNPALRQFRAARGGICIGPRIGINVAVDLPLRFYLKTSRFVSTFRLGRRRSIAYKRGSA